MPDEMNRNRHLDFLPACKTSQISMKHSACNRINLPILKDYVMDTVAFDIKRKDCVYAGICPDNGRQILQIGNRADAFAAATVNDDRDFALFPQTAVIILTKGLLFEP